MTVATKTPAKKAPAKAADKPAAAPVRRKRIVHADGPAVDRTVRISSIPDASIAERYVHRKIAGVWDFILFDFAHANHRNVLLEGPTGCGKTMAVQAWAAANEQHFYSVSNSIGISPDHLFGKFVPDAGGGVKWVDGPVTDIVRNGGTLLLNELNFMPDRVGTVLFSLLDSRREIQLVEHEGEVVQAHDDCFIVADMNPDYTGTRPLSEAMQNRFPDRQQWDYDERVEAKLIPIPALRDLAKQIRRQTDDFYTPTSTNMLVEFVQAVQYVGMEYAESVFVAKYKAEERVAMTNLFSTAHRGNIERDVKALVDDKKSGFDLMTPYDEPRFDADAGEWNVDWTYDAHDAWEDKKEATV